MEIVCLHPEALAPSGSAAAEIRKHPGQVAVPGLGSSKTFDPAGKSTTLVET
jgi:hypothetical protein